MFQTMMIVALAVAAVLAMFALIGRGEIREQMGFWSGFWFYLAAIDGMVWVSAP